MKKKLIIGIVVAVLLLALIVTAVIIIVKYGKFHSEGVHLDGDYIHVEGTWTGYAFDPETGELVGQTPVTINGNSDKKEKKFNGEMSVLGYRNVRDGQIVATTVTEPTDTGFYLIHYFEECYHEADLENKVSAYSHQCEYYYTYYFYPEKGDFVAVEVMNSEFEDDVTVICASSEEQAKADFAWFMENKPE